MQKEKQFELGDHVKYTNPNGVYIGVKKIIGYELWSGEHYSDHRYYIEPSDTPWYPVSEESLKLCTD
ncbi:hypothetical protein SAMN05661091_4164 [Paenibacillus uliginis N3/975]|uniref:Uncharacterized protein n=1 Tax=Paenibacillus uliginis N3/975 TaxID=1313296 RepID=A0A1X7HKY1_9BACL|nr:hypothetical protein [Paenibacillus uliginis]SMF88189.1 hypothetical protein SAMN05661091_4164 [Paenibacillus uliginis N3/975]